MISYKKLNDAEEYGAPVCEDDLNYKNAFPSFLLAENYPHPLNNYSQNHFLNDGTRIPRDYSVHDIIYGQVPDTKQPPQNMAPKKINTPYPGNADLLNFYHPQGTELREPQSKEMDQNAPCFDFPMDLSNVFLQNSGLYESQDAYQNINSSYSLDMLADSISTNSSCMPTCDELKNIQSNTFYHFPRDHSPDFPGIFSEGINTKGFEILSENSEHRFQFWPSLESNIKSSNSLNDINGANKDLTINGHNNGKPKLTESKTLPTAVEKSFFGDFKRQKTSQNETSFREFTIPNSNQSLNYQLLENFGHSLKNSSVPNFPTFNVPIQELLPNVNVAVFPSNARPNQNAEILVGSKNVNFDSQILHYEPPKKNIHLAKKENSETFSKEPKSFEHVLKHKSFSKSNDPKIIANKRPKTDYVKILPAIVPSKQIPTVNITIHQVPNTCKIPQSNYVDALNMKNNHPMVNDGLHYTDRNLKKALTLKKSSRKIPVSIRARNAKFLCTEKDLRCRTVRELLETCETIQGKTGMRAKVAPSMNISCVPAENFYEHAPQVSLPQMDCLNNPSNDPEIVANKEIETFQPQTSPEFYDWRKKTINLQDQRIYDLKNNNKINVIPADEDLVRVYQPVVDTWKVLKSSNDKKNAFKPRHFDFSFLQIRNFKYFCTDSDEKRTSKLKLIFSKKKLVYEFQLKETFDLSGGCMKHLAMIEIKFSSIVAMWGQNSEFRLEVNEAPHMYVGTRFCNKDQQFGPHQNAQYDRSRTADLTLGELYQVPFHYIQLRSVCVNKVLSYMSRFSPHFEQMLRCPLIEDMRKVLPQMKLNQLELVPVRINKICMSNNGLELNKQVVPNQWQPKVTNLFHHQIEPESLKI